MKTVALVPVLVSLLQAGPHDTAHVTFIDQFKGFSSAATGVLDGHSVWQTSFNAGARTLTNNHEAEWYEDAGLHGPFSLQGGALVITAHSAAGLPGGLSYVSGLITTQQMFHQTYGYFEICAQLPRGKGFWPAFWLLPMDGSWPPEIDVMEMLGNDTTDYYASVHSKIAGDNIAKIAAPDLTTGFHVFGVSWRPDHIRYYLDGVQVREVSTPPDMYKPMYLLANLAVGGAGSWPGSAAAGSATYKIKWIKAWQFNDLK